ncbi:hypothetical protein Cantr_06948 [Candida viswanathii]|uniref:Uncharacterized protein n=1 Tax=Candida viswanathii TaxID=5486 RepID=A0A367XVG7_9ASCO|nr:hypothetical protein Cantr_06948 [Candida viswanathii]
MWIVRHKNDRGGELRYLFPETNYMIGRDDSADFLFHSQKSSRELVELVTGPCTAERTPLYLRIVSRAKSIINGKTYKLKGKDAPVVEMDFTKEPRIIVECSASAGAESQMINPDTPVVIEWVEFSLFVRAVDEFVERAQAHKVGFRLVDKVGDATHYYSDGKDEESDEFKEAVFRGIPVLARVGWTNTVPVNEKQVEATPEVPATNESDDTSNTKEFTPSDDGGQPMLDSEDVVKAQREASIASAEPQLSEDTAPTVRVDSSQNDTQPGESDSLVGRKRKLESSTDKKPTKIGKFVPKVSLVEAVLQVKESNKPEVVELDDNIEDLKNLTIVEVVDLVPRKNKDKNDENEGFILAGRTSRSSENPRRKPTGDELGW